MPRTRKSEKRSAEVWAPISADILDQIVRDGPLTAEEIETASRRFTKALLERALGGELTHHLRYPPAGGAKPELAGNHRNGTSGKTVLTDDGPVAIAVPRDRAGTFEPPVIGKHERHFTGFDDKVIALYARQAPLNEPSNHRTIEPSNHRTIEPSNYRISNSETGNIPGCMHDSSR